MSRVERVTSVLFKNGIAVAAARVGVMTEKGGKIGGGEDTKSRATFLNRIHVRAEPETAAVLNATEETFYLPRGWDAAGGAMIGRRPANPGSVVLHLGWSS
jgi:hypothetical protein